MSKEAVNPGTVFPSLEHGFSQGVASSGARTLYLAGQVAWDAERRLVGGDDLEAQAMRAFANVRAVVEAAGGTVADVVSLRIYIVDYHTQKAPAVSRALRHYFTGEVKPASTWIGVAALADPGFLIEVEAIAVLD